jgi:FkbM family methyltransferase
MDFKHYFLDCGFHFGEGLGKFISEGIIDERYEIHAFEANPECKIEQRVKNFKFPIKPLNVAVWIEDGFVNFNQENHKKSGTGSPTDGVSDIDGWGSSIEGIDFEHSGYETKVKVRSIDFSEYLKGFPVDSYIVCKMDIEGSEYQILRKLLKDGSIKKINKLYVEFHSRFMRNETSESEDELIKQIEEFGIEVHTWF